MSHPVIWFEVTGSNAKKLQSFYGELFDWKIKADNPMNYGAVDKLEGGIPGGIGPSENGFPAGVRFYVGAKDLAVSIARAEKLGGKQVMPPTKLPDGLSIALLSDPEGHVIGLVEQN